MKLEFVKYEKRHHVAMVTINRPAVMNALHPATHFELDQVWNDFAADRGLRVAILTGAGDKAFSAGNDLKWTAEHAGGKIVLPPSGFGGLCGRLDLDKPVIAAVNGLALGGGFEIALACDIIVAADHARFGLPEPRVGLIAGVGGVQRLPRQLPLKIAMGMILTGKPISVAQAAAFGLVNEVVPAAELHAAAERWAAEIVECAPLSVQRSKRLARDTLPLPLDQALAQGLVAVQEIRASKDGHEGPLAFAQKRKPQWSGE
jgi:enoyl-CoA hydratase/carnithine racemase